MGVSQYVINAVSLIHHFHSASTNCYLCSLSAIYIICIVYEFLLCVCFHLLLSSTVNVIMLQSAFFYSKLNSPIPPVMLHQHFIDMPFSLYHPSTLHIQSFGEPHTSIVRAATMVRYSLLPLWYTVFFEAYTTGQPVMRTMFSEFPNDSNTFAMDDQWLIGASLLVKPATAEGQLSVDVYLPHSVDTDGWYDLHTLQRAPVTASRMLTVSVPLEVIPVYIRSGNSVKLYRIKSHDLISPVRHCYCRPQSTSSQLTYPSCPCSFRVNSITRLIASHIFSTSPLP